MILAFFILFGLAFSLTAGLVPLVRRGARRWGFLDEPGGRKAHAVATPLGGGLAVAAAVTLTLAAGIACAAAAQRELLPLRLPEAIRLYLPGALSQAFRLLIILGCGLVMAGVGLLDDLRDLSPRIKLAGQAVVALVLILAGDVRLSLFADNAGLPGRLVSGSATLLWILAVTNAFNLIDHMDGICAGTAAVCGTIFLAVALQTGQFFIAAMLLVLVGAAAGFLLYNFHPATIFLGDAGSQFIGYFMAVATVLFTFYRPPYPLFSYGVPVIVLAVPFYDVLRVVLIRLADGRSPFQGDRNHLSHRLVRLGFSVRQSAGIVYLLTAATGLAAVLMYDVTPPAALIVLAQVGLVLLLVACLDSRGRGASESGPSPGASS